MSEPHLSVVISTHNRPVEVREAIAAVVGQDHDGPIETLVVWDKTEPEAELASDDGWRPVRVLSNDRTPGLPGSRNTGAAAASAPVLGFGDDDDLWEPSKARLQLELMGRTGAPTVGCGILISTGDRVYERPTIGSAVRFEDLLHRRSTEASMGCALVRKDAFWNDIGPVDETIPGGYAEDWEWWLRASKYAPVPIVRQGLYRVNWSGSTFFRDRWEMMEQAHAELLERFPEFRSDRRGLGNLLGKRAFASAAAGNRRAAWDLVRETIRANPLEPRAALAVAVLLGIDPSTVLSAVNRAGRGI